MKDDKLSTPSEEMVRRLFPRTTHGIKLGLDRMRSAARRFGDPQDSYSSIHVAGTNGKGSTCAFIEAGLRQRGRKTGLFTSPHLVSFEERFIVNGAPVRSGLVLDVYRDLETAIEETGLTFFEAATLIAFELFKRENVDVAVFETGMGGRLDSTNVIRPAACAITRIAMDHMNFLGKDLPAIAGEKLGIVKEGVPCVMARPDSGEVRALARRRCAETGSPLEFANAVEEVLEIKDSARGVSFTYDNHRFDLPLCGAHQVQNALVAVKTLRVAGFSDLKETAEALRKAFLPGRFQVFSTGAGTIVFDVGHNPDAAQSFVETLSSRFKDVSICFVIGIMKDKDISGMLEQYCKKAGAIIFTRPEGERSAETAFLKSQLPQWFCGQVREIQAVRDAVNAALISPERLVCIAGSFYTVGEAMVGLGISPYAQRPVTDCGNPR